MISKIIPVFNELVKSQGLSLAIMTLLLAFFMYNQRVQDKDRTERIHKLENQVYDLNEWRANELQKQNQILLDCVYENTQVLKDVIRKLND